MVRASRGVAKLENSQKNGTKTQTLALKPLSQGTYNEE
jgi:hypothetical protein